MLDDLNFIKQKDPQGFLGFAATQPGQLKHDFGLSGEPLNRPLKNVVFAGMGGSALVAELAKSYPPLNLPFEICKDYNLPNYVGAETLVICASYSGNTEETLNCLSQAEAKGAVIVTIAHGGKLAELSAQKNYRLLQIPECPQPRAAVFYMYRALMEILVAVGLVEANIINQLEDVADKLSQTVSLWGPSTPENQNYAKQLAQQCLGKTPIIYGGPKTFAAAYKWKIDFNENAKNTAWCNAYSEFNHNEFIGWSSHPVQKPFAVIDLLSSFEDPRILKRFELSDRLLSGMRPKATTVHAAGDSLLEQLLYLVLLGDFATTYLAILNGVNPTPVDLVEKFKKELSSFSD